VEILKPTNFCHFLGMLSKGLPYMLERAGLDVQQGKIGVDLCLKMNEDSGRSET
jgi:hypothetical protein